MSKHMNTTSSIFRRMVGKGPFSGTHARLAARNASWILGEKLVGLLFGLFVGVAVARYLGPENYGILNYATALVAFFGPVASLGLNNIVTRDLVAEREQEQTILGTVFWLRCAGALACAPLAVLLVLILRPDDTQVMVFVAALSLGLAARSFVVIEYWFQSHVDSKPVTIARTAALATASLFKLTGIFLQRPLWWFVAAALIEVLLKDVFLVGIYNRKQQAVGLWRFSRKTAAGYLKVSWPLIFSGVAAIVYLRIDTVMIGQMVSDSAVGVYSAAVRISEVWYILPASIAVSVFPRLVALRSQDLSRYHRKLDLLYGIMALLGWGVAIITTLFGVQLMTILFGPEFRVSGYVLRIHVWAGVFIFLRAILSKWILSENVLYLSLLTQGSGAVLNIAANLLLIPRFGIEGAAWASLVSYAGGAWLILFFIPRTRATAWIMTKALVFPVTIIRLLRSDYSWR